MEQQLGYEPVSDEAQVRAFIDAPWPRNVQDLPRVRYVRAAGRMTLLVLLAFSLQ